MKVFVGLSGGVDSAVSAALLKEQGHAVTGVFIRIYRPEFIACTWRDDRVDAMRVCASLSIPFREVDLSSDYKRSVVDAMVDDYRHGITPNPDVLCNERIKFGAFFSWALQQGADAVATGHYARIRSVGEERHLERGSDTSKDQSYFLYRLGQEQLRRCFFPIGELSKRDVRRMAHSLALPVADKPDSQGICFVGDVSIADFLKRYISVVPGPVVDMSGTAVGAHSGASLVTIGQRHGFQLNAPYAREPHYVIAIDAAMNAITVSPRREDAAGSACVARELSWTSSAPRVGQRLSAQTRYREKPIAATVERVGPDKLAVHFGEPHIAPPGQSLVLYDGDRVLGGGVIEKRG